MTYQLCIYLLFTLELFAKGHAEKNNNSSVRNVLHEEAHSEISKFPYIHKGNCTSKLKIHVKKSLNEQSEKILLTKHSFNHIQSVAHLKQHTHSERKKYTISKHRRSIRGQTQSQYLNFGNRNDSGVAEAESTFGGSRAFVSGSNGMGQAQSQSAPLDCTGCFQYGRDGQIPQYEIPRQKPGDVFDIDDSERVPSRPEDRYPGTPVDKYRPFRPADRYRPSERPEGPYNGYGPRRPDEEFTRPGEIPRRPGEIPRRPGEIPRRPEEVHRRPGEIPRIPEEVPRRPGEIPRRPEELPRRPEEVPRRPGEIPRRPEEVPRRPGEIPRRPEEVPRRPEEIPRRPGEIPRGPGEVPGEPGEIPGRVGVPRRPGEVPIQPGEVSRRPGEVPGESGEIPGRVEVPRRPGEVPIRPGEVPIRPGEVPRRPGQLPERPGEIPYRPEEVLRPTDIRPGRPEDDVRRPFPPDIHEPGRPIDRYRPEIPYRPTDIKGGYKPPTDVIDTYRPGYKGERYEQPYWPSPEERTPGYRPQLPSTNGERYIPRVPYDKGYADGIRGPIPPSGHFSGQFYGNYYHYPHGNVYGQKGDYYLEPHRPDLGYPQRPKGEVQIPDEEISGRYRPSGERVFPPDSPRRTEPEDRTLGPPYDIYKPGIHDTKIPEPQGPKRPTKIDADRDRYRPAPPEQYPLKPGEQYVPAIPGRDTEYRPDTTAGLKGERIEDEYYRRRPGTEYRPVSGPGRFSGKFHGEYYTGDRGETRRGTYEKGRFRGEFDGTYDHLPDRIDEMYPSQYNGRKPGEQYDTSTNGRYRPYEEHYDGGDRSYPSHHLDSTTRPAGQYDQRPSGRDDYWYPDYSRPRGPEDGDRYLQPSSIRPPGRYDDSFTERTPGRPTGVTDYESPRYPGRHHYVSPPSSRQPSGQDGYTPAGSREPSGPPLAPRRPTDHDEYAPTDIRKPFDRDGYGETLRPSGQPDLSRPPGPYDYDIPSSGRDDYRPSHWPGGSYDYLPSEDHADMRKPYYRRPGDVDQYRPSRPTDINRTDDYDIYGHPSSIRVQDNRTQIFEDDGTSQAQSSVQHINNETQAVASAEGTYAGGTAQSQVSGTYSGSGSFSASAGTIDGKRGSQTQVSGGKKGALSSSQGIGGVSQSQAQIQMASETGETHSNAQSGGYNHGTNTQVQAGNKGGMADAQANGPGSTSSQAQIGFIPHDEGEENQNKSYNGGGTASAQSGTHFGQSQVQLQGKFYDGIKYKGAAQAGSGTNGTLTPQSVMFEDPKKFLSLQPLHIHSDPVKQTHTEIVISTTRNPSTTTVPTTTTSTTTEDNYHNTYSSIFTSEENTLPPTLQNHKNTSTNTEDNYDYEYEEYDATEQPTQVMTRKLANTNLGNQHITFDPTETFEESLIYPRPRFISQVKSLQNQHIVLDPLEDLDISITQTQGPSLPRELLLQPGESIPGSPEIRIPAGFRGKVKSISGHQNLAQGLNSQGESVAVSPGTYKKPVYTVLAETQSRQGGVGFGGSYTYQPVQYQVKTGKSYPNFVSVTKSETGSRNIHTGKKTPSVYYTQTSSCGYFTNTCVYSGGKKICMPRPRTNPDGSLVKC